MAITSISVHATAEVDAASINVPATVTAGDLLVLSERQVGTSDTTISGWNLVGFQANATRSVKMSWKIATSSDAGATVTSINGPKLMVVYRANEAISSATQASPLITVNDGNPTQITVTASGGAVPLIVLGTYVTNNTVDPRTFTAGGVGAKDGESARVDLDVYQAYKLYTSSPADIVIDMDDEGLGNGLVGCYLNLASISFVTSNASSSGVATANAVGGSLFNSVMNAAGVATANAVGEAITFVDSVMNAAGVATANAVGDSVQFGDAAMNAAGVATATAEGGAISSAVMNAAGVATASAEGALSNIVEGAASAAGSATAAAVGDFIEIVPPADLGPNPYGGGGGSATWIPGASPRVKIRTPRKVATIRVGEWPEEPDPREARRREDEEYFNLIDGIKPEHSEDPVDDEEELLMMILSLAA